MKLLRQKQKPFFSTLEEMELDTSSSPLEFYLQPPSEPLPERPSKREPEPVIEPATETAPETVPESIPEPELKFISEPAAVTPAWPSPLPPLPATTARPISEPHRKPDTGNFDAIFVDIAPGTFIMGSPEDEPGRRDDETHHEVTITRGFCIQATPVTQGQWKSVMGTNPSNFVKEGLDCPVEGVSWNDCQEFIRKLNQKGEYGYRLPTEAEWEYACRARTNTAFYDGEIIKKRFGRKDTCLEAIGWYTANSDGKTHPVADKKPNAWGLFDMHGNVCEWCQDWYGMYPLMPQRDPRGVMIGPGCLVRGGSWTSTSQDCRSARRLYHSPNSRSKFVGLRLVREPKY